MEDEIRALNLTHSNEKLSLQKEIKDLKNANAKGEIERGKIEQSKEKISEENKKANDVIKSLMETKKNLKEDNKKLAAEKEILQNEKEALASTVKEKSKECGTLSEEARLHSITIDRLQKEVSEK